MNIRIFDTTLRDGEQSPGVSLSPEKKLNIAKKLDELGIDAIETGFPIISAGEKEGVKLIVAEGLNAELCGLARTNKKDIDAAVDCGLNYIHTFIATSDIHLEYKLKMSRDEALEKAIEAVEYGKSRGLQVEFSAEDATRTDREFLKKVFGEVVLVDHSATLDMDSNIAFFRIQIEFEPDDLIKPGMEAIIEHTIGEKKDAILINLSRGGVVEESALFEHLSNNLSCSAALDVFEQEPATGNKLSELDNVILTPHIGAQTKEAQSLAANVIGEKIIQILRGVI